jgi:hypothetical protein
MGEAHQIFTDAWLKGKPRSIELVFPVPPSSAGLLGFFPLETKPWLTKHFYQARSDDDSSPLRSLGVSASRQLLLGSLVTITF